VNRQSDKRAFILVLDGFGIGTAPDSADYGDEGADTLGHLADACFRGAGDRKGLRKGPLQIPFLESNGLGNAAALAGGKWPRGMSRVQPRARFAACREISHGKDTSSGHWEMAGVPVLFEWDYFPEEPSFPSWLLEALVREGNLPGVLGNCHASGTEIIKDLGDQHLRSGRPICYTSADSVFQIAAHEESFGLERLYALCSTAREILDREGLNVARVIARPFTGTAGNYIRTAGRKDFSVPPPGKTLPDLLQAEGRKVLALGKIGEIFALRGITEAIKAPDNNAIFRLVSNAVEDSGPGSLTFANFVDFDMLYGHRRDIAGYAHALEALDPQLEELSGRLRPGDLAIITSDHGCDPGFRGANHTREYVPAILLGPEVIPGNAGIRDTFADIGQTVASHLGISPLDWGTAIDFTG